CPLNCRNSAPNCAPGMRSSLRDLAVLAHDRVALHPDVGRLRPRVAAREGDDVVAQGSGGQGDGPPNKYACAGMSQGWLTRRVSELQTETLPSALPLFRGSRDRALHKAGISVS